MEEENFFFDKSFYMGKVGKQYGRTEKCLKTLESGEKY